MSSLKASLSESMSGEITMRSILSVAEMIHLQELERRDEQIKRLQENNQLLERENQELKLKFSEFRRSSNEEKGLFEQTYQQREQLLLVQQAKNKALESEFAKAQQELKSKVAEVAKLKSECDKANHIIRKLLNKPSTYIPSACAAPGRMYDPREDIS